MIPRILQLSTALCALALTCLAQEAAGDLPYLRGRVGGQDDRPQSGVAVRMFESPTLDRFVRKAQDFLAREDYTGAIKVLQDVLEDRISAPGEEEAPRDPEAQMSEGAFEDDPTHAVFSADHRLYRPVRRLCQELLAALPAPGLALYQEMYEVAAEQAYHEALERRDARALAETFDRYFVTLAAAKAMYAAGDLLMHEGRYRAAVQTYRTLLTVYPAENRARVAAISDIYVEIKMALCFARMREGQKARDVLARLEREHGNAAVRVHGELTSLANLAERAWFADDYVSPVTTGADTDHVVLRSLQDGLVPVWQFRYADPDPYRRPSGSTNPRFVVSEGSSPAAPWYNRHKPGGVVRFDTGELAFMDHFRLRAHDLGSGLLRGHTDEADKPPKPRQGKARVRIPVYDYVAQRVAADREHYYCVIGPEGSRNLPGLEPILRNDLVAYDRRTFEQVWSTSDWEERGQHGTTFLATPTVFGQRLLVPVLSKGAYGLLGVDAATGEPLFTAQVHSGGTDLARAPSVPIVVHSGTAFVLTNSGTVAAVDAFTGDVQWVRRYERDHPLRSTRRPRASTGKRNQIARQYFRHVTLPGFVPSDLVVADGLVVLAPSDGSVLMCLDGATGEPVWMVSKPHGTDVHIVGRNSRHLFVSGERMTCLELRTGIRLWDIELPEPAWMGRGLVTEQRVIVPGGRCVYSLPAEGVGGWRKTDLPDFSVGRSPLSGPANLFAHGPYLVAAHEGGIEVFASLEGLHELAQAAVDPVERADLLVQAGDLLAAIETLGPECIDEQRPPAERKKLARRTLALVRDVALARATPESRDHAVALLDRTRGWIETKDLLLQWQLLRIELFQALRDSAAVDREQATLDRMMEGRQ